MTRAHKLEDHLTTDQTMIGPTGLDWLDPYLINCETEDTSVIILTSSGPYRLIKLDDGPLRFIGQREPCEVFDALRTPPASRYEPLPRTKKHRPMEGEESLFETAGYEGRKPKKRELYEQEMAQPSG